MDIAFDIALMAHLLSLLAAGAALIGIPVVAARMGSATAETRPLLGGIVQSLGRAAQISFAVLIVSGPLMVWLRYGGVEGLNSWFWVKMALIVVMIGAMIVGGRLRAAGNVAAAGSVAWVSRAALVGVVIAAVLTFE
jgi:protoporphyrinogen IX oxidase